MALRWGFLVAIFAILAGFAEAQANITFTATPSTTTLASQATTTLTTSTPAGGSVTPMGQIVTTATATVAPASSTVGPVPTTGSPAGLGFSMYLKVTLIFKSECASAKDNLINSTFTSLFADQKFDFVNISLKVNGCNYECAILFGPKLMVYKNISEVLEVRRKSLIDKWELKDLKIKVYVVPGIAVGDWEVETEDCKKHCCEGTGSPFIVRRKCEPSSEKCKKFEKKVLDCPKYCSKKCSGVMCKISLLVLFVGAFMNWFLK